MLLIVPGRATFRNLSRYSDDVEKTFSRWFRWQVDWAGLNVAAIRAAVPSAQESVDAYLAHLNRVIPKRDLARLRDLTADGYFSKVKFVDGVVALKLDLISKLRRDADARYLYTGPYAGCGAPRRYAGKVDWTHRDPAVFTAVASPDPALRLETALVYLPRLRRCVRVVVVIHRRTQRLALLI